jgi:hypothetical protein
MGKRREHASGRDRRDVPDGSTGVTWKGLVDEASKGTDDIETGE